MRISFNEIVGELIFCDFYLPSNCFIYKGKKYALRLYYYYNYFFNSITLLKNNFFFLDCDKEKTLFFSPANTSRV